METDTIQPGSENDQHDTKDIFSRQAWYTWFEKGLWVFLFLVGIVLAAAISLAIFYYAPWDF